MNIIQQNVLNKQRNTRTENRQRIHFRVTEWNEDTSIGQIRDHEGYAYFIGKQDLDEGVESLCVGDIVSGYLIDANSVSNLIVEKSANPAAAATQPRTILIPVIKCSEKEKVASYAEHLVNTGKYRGIKPDVNHPYAVDGPIIREGIYWNVSLVPAGSRIDHDRSVWTQRVRLRTSEAGIPIVAARPEALSVGEIPYLRPGADVEWEKL
jgi:hypothetical protein